jgi:hypothetical protein
VVSVLTTGPMGLSAAGSGPAEDGGLLWVIKIRSAHFLRRGSNVVDSRHVKEPYRALLRCSVGQIS